MNLTKSPEWREITVRLVLEATIGLNEATPERTYRINNSESAIT
jgi:hypothetical protein